jgi:D-sedoheptulose 7-phosphate isomerase
MVKRFVKKNCLGRLLRDGRNGCDNLRNYGRYVSELIGRLDYAAIQKVIRCFLDARRRNSTIFFMGNGGSAATASHFAQDLGEAGRKAGTKCFRTISLNDSVSSISALANDYGYENIFTAQMGNLFKKGDVLVALSASGNSRNIIRAVKRAKTMGGKTVGFVGFDGGEVSKLCDLVVLAVTDKGEYGPVEDIHMVLCHMMTSHIMYNDKGAAGRVKR